jgi:hypothetical protein
LRIGVLIPGCFVRACESGVAGILDLACSCILRGPVGSFVGRVNPGRGFAGPTQRSLTPSTSKSRFSFAAQRLGVPPFRCRPTLKSSELNRFAVYVSKMHAEVRIGAAAFSARLSHSEGGCSRNQISSRKFSMSPLRQRMAEEMRRRNYSTETQRAYVHYIAEYAKYFGVSPDQLGPEAIRNTSCISPTSGKCRLRASTASPGRQSSSISDARAAME